MPRDGVHPWQALSAQLAFTRFGEPTHPAVSWTGIEYCSLPQRALMQIKSSGSTLWNADSKVDWDISDHCPVAVLLNVRQLLLQLTKHQKYIDKVQLLQNNANFDSMSLFQRLDANKQILRDASSLALRDMGRPNAPKPETHQTLVACGQAIWCNLSG
jgi:hypothetical protein